MKACRWQSCASSLLPATEPAMPGVVRNTSTLAAMRAYVTQGVRRTGFTSWTGMTTQK